MTLVVVESARGQAMTPARAAWAEVARCDAHLAMHLSAALRRFGAAALGLVDLPAIELPSLDVDGADGADGVGVVSDVRPSAPELHVAAVLLWARHVEEGGLLELVAALAAAVATGSLPMTLGGETARKLVLLYRQRDEHFSLEERRALYQHLFADPVQRRLDALLEALTELGDAGPRESLVRPRARLAVLARQLAGELSARATGMAAFAARDLVTQVREALALLSDPDLARALGGGTPWTLVARHAPTLLRRRVDPTSAITRASAGRAVIAYLAEHVRELVAGTLAPAPSDPVVHAAALYCAQTEGGS